MKESVLSKLLVVSLLIANYGCQSKNEDQSSSQPKYEEPSPDNAPCYDGNGNQECTDEAKRSNATEQSAPVVQETIAEPVEAPQAAVQAPAELEKAPQAAVQAPVEVEKAPQAAVQPSVVPAAPQAAAEPSIETKEPVAEVIPPAAVEAAPAETTAEAQAPSAPASL